MNKKVTPYIYGVTAAAVTIATAGVMSALILGNGEPKAILPPEKEALAQKDPAYAQELANVVLEQKCAACHGENADYNGFVNFFAFGKLRRDVEGAQRAFTMTPDKKVRSRITDLAKMDYVLRTGKMPPAAYTMMHPGSFLTDADIKLLRYAYGKTDFEPIKPYQAPTGLSAEEQLKESRRVLLGHLLFFDGRLSTNNKVSCSSCHDLQKGGTDNLAKSEGVPKTEGAPGPDGKPQLGGVNAPTVFNAAGHIRQFWDGRATDLQDQAAGPPLNPVEMGYAIEKDWDKIIAKLADDECYRLLFNEVYEGEISKATITHAIAAFEKTLVTPNSAFDCYLKGDKSALTEQQIAGMEAFRAYGCASCHSGATLGGNSFEYINTNAPLRAHAKGYREGAYGIYDRTKEEKDRDMFRVPTLRNVALTAPYFHTGTVTDLSEAVRIMFETQTTLHPSTTTINNVTAFLHAQTGQYKGTPLDKLTRRQVLPDYARANGLVLQQKRREAEKARKAQEAARQNTAPQTVQSPIMVETLGVRTVIEAPATQPPSPVPATEQQPQN